MSDDAPIHPLEAGRQLHDLAQSEQRKDSTLPYAEALRRVLTKADNWKLVDAYRRSVPHER